MAPYRLEFRSPRERAVERGIHRRLTDVHASVIHDILTESGRAPFADNGIAAVPARSRTRPRTMHLWVIQSTVIC
jgi:hypothetical protein